LEVRGLTVVTVKELSQPDQQCVNPSGIVASLERLGVYSSGSDKQIPASGTERLSPN
jgi:hypothetical protein